MPNNLSDPTPAYFTLESGEDRYLAGTEYIADLIKTHIWVHRDLILPKAGSSFASAFYSLSDAVVQIKEGE